MQQVWRYTGARRMRVAMGVVAACLLIGLGYSGQSQASVTRHRCGHVSVDHGKASAKVLVRRGPERCAAARQVVARAFGAVSSRHWNGTSPELGIYWRVGSWDCFVGLASTEVMCYLGPTRVDGSVNSRDGWSFSMGPLAASRTAGPSATATTVPPLLGDGREAMYKPSRFCPSNHSCFTHAHWRSWGNTAVATAQGITGYPGGATHRGTAIVKLSDPKRMCGGVRYTKASWRYPALDYPAHGQWISDGFFRLPGDCGQWSGA